MNIFTKITSGLLTGVVAAGAFALAGAADMASGGAGNVMLSGNQEVPPVTTSATGTGTIAIGMDKSVSGGVTTTGITATAAHIHEGAVGVNGPVIIPLTKTSDNVWSVPPGARLTDAQFESYKTGKLYVNVHSAVNKGGEIRTQLKP